MFRLGLQKDRIAPPTTVMEPLLPGFDILPALLKSRLAARSSAPQEAGWLGRLGLAEAWWGIGFTKQECSAA